MAPQPPSTPTPASPPPPRPPAAPQAFPEPATLEDVQGLRRWLWVVAIWAVAASAIALIALIDRPDDPKPDRDAARIASLERRVDTRLTALERQVSEAGKAEDLSRLQSRLDKAEKAAADAESASEGATKELSSLDKRVEELETRTEALADQQKTAQP